MAFSASRTTQPQPGQRGGGRPAAGPDHSLAHDLEDEEGGDYDDDDEDTGLEAAGEDDHAGEDEQQPDQDDDVDEDEGEGRDDSGNDEVASQQHASQPDSAQRVKVARPLPAPSEAHNPFDDEDEDAEEEPGEDQREEVEEEEQRAEDGQPDSPDSSDSFKARSPEDDAKDEDEDEDEDGDEGADEEADDENHHAASAGTGLTEQQQNEGAVISLPSSSSSSSSSNLVLSSSSALPKPAQAGDWAQATVVEPELPDTDLLSEAEVGEAKGEEASEEVDDVAAEEGEDEDEEEEEPILKYARVGADVSRLLHSTAQQPPQDTARCLLAHSKFLLLATSSGTLYMLDHHGNEIQHYTLHSAPINDLSLDASGEFVASCSMDGNVVVTNLYSKEVTRYGYGSNVLSVALPAQYKAAAMFASGGADGRLVVNKKGWFSANQIVIHSGEGAVHCVRWRREFIAWSNDAGVKVYDVNTSERITHIKFDLAKGSKTRAHLTWTADDELAIAYGPTVKVGRVKERALTKAERQQHPDRHTTRFVQITALFSVDYRICGISTLDANLVLLSLPSEDDDDDEVARPELRIVTRAGVEVRVDVLPIHGYEMCSDKDYRLTSLQDEASLSLFIVAPHDLLTAKPRDADDHVHYLHSLQRYHDALVFSQSSPPPVLLQFTRQSIVDAYLGHLFSIHSYAQCAQECSALLGLNQSLWEDWIHRFEAAKKLSHMVAFIPTFNPQLKDALYEAILRYFLDESNREDKDAPRDDSEPAVPTPPEEAYTSNLSVFLKLITSWNKHIYDTAKVIALIKAKLTERAAAHLPPHPLLLESQAELYLIQHQYHLALSVFLGLKRHDIFTLIRELHLFHVIQDKLLQLMTFDSKQAVALLIDHHDKCGVADVMAQLKGHRQFQFLYLHSLVRHLDYNVPDLSLDVGDLLLSLYAEFQPAELLNYLRSSHQFRVDSALELCEKGGHHKELIYLYKHMGNSQLALKIILGHLKNVHMAIEFVEDEKDDVLWEELIGHSVRDGKMLGELLLYVGEYAVDLRKLVERVPDSMEIDGLKGKLMGLLRDQALQVHVLRAGKKVMEGDVERAVDERRQKEGEGVEVTRCDWCRDSVLGGALGRGAGKRQRRPRRKRGEAVVDDGRDERKDKDKDDGVVVFFCHHSFHRACLVRATKERRGQAHGAGGAPEAAAALGSKANPFVCVRCEEVKVGGKKAMEDRRDEEVKEAKEESKAVQVVSERVVTSEGTGGKSTLVVPSRPTIVTAQPVAKPAPAKGKAQGGKKRDSKR